MVGRWGRDRVCRENFEIDRESRKYKGKRPCVGFTTGFYPILIRSGDELSKCSLKYEPSVFNININVKDGITIRYFSYVKSDDSSFYTCIYVQVNMTKSNDSSLFTYTKVTNHLFLFAHMCK